jgi:hypothetical protein
MFIRGCTRLPTQGSTKKTPQFLPRLSSPPPCLPCMAPGSVEPCWSQHTPGAWAAMTSGVNVWCTDGPVLSMDSCPSLSIHVSIYVAKSPIRIRLFSGPNSSADRGMRRTLQWQDWLQLKSKTCCMHKMCAGIAEHAVGSCTMLTQVDFMLDWNINAHIRWPLLALNERTVKPKQGMSVWTTFAAASSWYKDP